MKVSNVFFLSAVIFLTGCVSAEDKRANFIEKNQFERAKLVCNKATSARTRVEQLNYLKEAISAQAELLKEGMRLKRTCQAVNKSACAICTPNVQTVCTDHAVPINPYFEQEQMEKYQAAFDELSAAHNSKQQSCLRSAAKMPADEAYMYYSSRMQPEG